MSSLCEAAATMMPAATSITKRDLPPANYLLKIKSYTKLLSELTEEKYETGVFEAGGNIWRLSFYPNGDEKNNGRGYISLYLAITGTDNYRPGWEVNVNFKMFVYDQIEDKYLVIQDIDVKRFHEMKKERGFARLLPLKTFKESSNGYLVNDSCVFGVEVFVIKSNAVSETVSFFKSTSNVDSFTWTIKQFFKLNKPSSCHSNYFNVQGTRWRLQVYPKGEDGEKKSISIFLGLANGQSQSNVEAVHTKFKLVVLDQVNGNHLESAVVRRWFWKLEGYGFPKFMSLDDLKNPSEGFIVKDTVIVKVVFF